MILKDEILKLRREGKSVNEINKILGCAKSTISYHINNNGLGGQIKGRNIQYNINSIEVQEIINLRKNGETINNIIIKSKLPVDLIRRVFRDLKLNKSNINKKEYDVLSIIKYYKEVKSLRLTAKKFKISRDTLRKHISDDIIDEVNLKYSKTEKKEKRSKSVIDWRNRTKLKLVEYKGGCCKKCGYNKNIKALQFHHLNPNEKDFNISGRSYSYDRMKKEVDKCILVCANCHIELHDTI